MQRGGRKGTQTLESTLVCFMLQLSHVRSTPGLDKVKLKQAKPGWLTIC